MPATPVIWKSAFAVNATTAGFQGDPDITQLSNGNVLVIWTSDNDTGVGSAAGTDIIGQIFDPVGNPVGVEFRVNQGFFLDAEANGDIVALPDGGFMMVFMDDETATSSGYDLRYSRFDSSGTNTSNGTIQSDADNVDPTYINPRIDVSGNTAMIVYQQRLSGGDYTVVGNTFDLTNNTVGSQIPLLAFPNGDTDADVTALTNGNFVITTTNSSSDSYIGYRIVTAAGANVLSATAVSGTNTDTNTDNEPTVQALTGGGFVIAWTQYDGSDTDVVFRTYNAAGTQTGSGQVNGGAVTDSRNEPTIAALADGSFVIVLDDDANAIGTRVQHYSSTGSILGSEVLAINADTTELSAIGLADGRFQIVASNAVSGEIGSVILDTRDAVNTTGGTVQVGLVGDDTFTGALSKAYGGAGNDTITEGSANFVSGDAGNDYIKATSIIGSDIWDGGIGTDTIDWSGAYTSGFNGLVFSLASGAALENGFSEAMVNFENVIGTVGNDNIIGNGLDNALIGFLGNDTLVGGAGNDVLIGGQGDDVYEVTEVLDQTIEAVNEGADTVVAYVESYGIGANIENLVLGGSIQVGFGSNTANLIVGNAADNTIIGRGGNDIMQGGAGNDTYEVTEVGDIVTELAGQGTDQVFSFAEGYILNANVENLILAGSTQTGFGNSTNNAVIGNGAANNIGGGAGDDILIGGSGVDSFFWTGTTVGKDIITDFDALALEKIVVSQSMFLNFAVVLNNSFQAGTDTVISYDSNTILVLKNVARNNLTANNFVFSASEPGGDHPLTIPATPEPEAAPAALVSPALDVPTLHDYVPTYNIGIAHQASPFDYMLA